MAPGAPAIQTLATSQGFFVIVRSRNFGEDDPMRRAQRCSRTGPRLGRFLLLAAAQERGGFATAGGPV